MKVFKLIVVFIFSVQLNAQVLTMPENIQENDQWCWAGVTKSVLAYYGENIAQCEIAEYARQQITWHDNGSTDCCVNPNLGCNYWNYAYGTAGSMEDILEHFGNVQNYGISNYLTESQVAYQLSEGRPFIVRWGWTSGGGHFVIGHGVNNNDFYYMDPWFGEGLHISTYNWIRNDGYHDWTHTNVITTNPVASTTNNLVAVSLALFPNPVKESLFIKADASISEVKLYNALGQLVLNSRNTKKIDLNNLKNGVYAVKIFFDDFTVVEKILIQH